MSTKTEHRCKHGKIFDESLLKGQCKIDAGNMSWKGRGVSGLCPYTWFMGDCPKFEQNPNFID